MDNFDPAIMLFTGVKKGNKRILIHEFWDFMKIQFGEGIVLILAKDGGTIRYVPKNHTSYNTVLEGKIGQADFYVIDGTPNSPKGFIMAAFGQVDIELAKDWESRPDDFVLKANELN